MGLKERLRRVEQLFSKGDLPLTAVVFGLGPDEDWEAGSQRYRSERGVLFERYVCFGDVGPQLFQAKDLADLRQLAGRYKVNLVVYPAGVSDSDLWGDEPQGGGEVGEHEH
jgi:hypothetical protein